AQHFFRVFVVQRGVFRFVVGVAVLVQDVLVAGLARAVVVVFVFSIGEQRGFLAQELAVAAPQRTLVAGDPLAALDRFVLVELAGAHVGDQLFGIDDDLALAA